MKSKYSTGMKSPFVLEIACWRELYSNWRKKLFKLLLNSSFNVFLRNGDIISVGPQVDGVWEPAITRFIGHYAHAGYNDFFIDIGANIGLTSCQNGNSFKWVEMYEPNPLCCNLIEVNCKINFEKKNYHLNKFGLGGKNKMETLFVPRNNWGGAFIKNNENSYSTETLVAKDGFQKISSENYMTVGIKLVDAKIEIRRLFEKLGRKKLWHGIIKIDVEGYEEKILIGLAKAIPTNFDIVLIFESLDKGLNMEAILAAFGGRAKPSKLERIRPWPDGAWKITKGLAVVLNRKIVTKMAAPKNNFWVGDIVLEIGGNH